MFGDLHSHSDYSIFDGFAKIDDKIKRAKELGYDALAMTEHGTTTGLMEFYLKCKQEGIIPILGYEGYFSNEPNVKGGKTYHIILLAKNLEGYKNILRLSTYASDHFYKKPRLGIEALRKYHEGVICSTACIAGVLQAENYADIVNELSNIFGDDFYLEIQPHDFAEQHEYNAKVLSLSEELGIPTIITGDSHYVWPDDCETHRKWLMLGSDSEYYASGDYHMMSKEEIIAKLPGVENTQCFDNVNEIIEKCKDLEIPLGERNFPVFDTDNPEEYVRQKCREGWKEKGIGNYPNSTKYGDQVNHELKVLRDCGYLNYICIIDDMLRWCKTNNIATGIGRGSVGGSLVAYLMGITGVDPIKYNLIFERFANPERVTEPDIDVDVSSSHRESVIDYIREKYGKVYQIRTIGYMSDKLATQRAGKALGYKPTLIDATSTSINSVEEIKDKEWRELAMKFIGHIANYGKHASAVVVFPKDVSNWCAIESQNGEPIAAQDFHLLEKQGIMKLDILGLETLDIITNTLKRIDEDINLDKIDMEDKLTGDMLRKGLTIGCFQIESQIMTDIIKSINAKSVHDLIDTVAIGRPGVRDIGMDKVFEARRQGREPVTYLHPKLEPILKDTEGVILYQEQIMQIAQTLCGYTYGKADNIRRVIGRKIVDEMKPIIDNMLESGVKNGIPNDIMSQICDMIVKFANYGFNRGHSAAYGITAWRTAYLKAHYPAQFMCALLDSVCSDKVKLPVYISHAKLLGLEVRQPDIMKSQMECTFEGNVIYLGFNSISGVGATQIEQGDDAFEYIKQHNKYNKTVLKNLVRAGVFDCTTYESRYELLEFIEWVKDKRKSKPPFQYSGEIGQEYAFMELETIGYMFHDGFKTFDLSLRGGNIHAYIVISITAHKTKKGKPMAFIKGIDSKNNVQELVYFGDGYKEIKKGKMYLMKVEDTTIREYVLANKKERG